MRLYMNTDAEVCKRKTEGIPQEKMNISCKQQHLKTVSSNNLAHIFKQKYIINF